MSALSELLAKCDEHFKVTGYPASFHAGVNGSTLEKARAAVEAERTVVAQRDELVILLKEAQRLGLHFDCGNAYIRRSYIDKQDPLNDRIKLLFDEIKGES